LSGSGTPPTACRTGDDHKVNKVATSRIAPAQPLHQRGQRLGWARGRRRGLAEELAAARELGSAGAVRQEAEVADAHEARRENVEEEAAEELLSRERHRLHAVPPGVVLPPACREPSRTEADPTLVRADQPVIGDRHAVGVAAEVLEDLGRPGDRRLGFVVSSAERRPRPSREHGAGGAIRGLRHMRITGTQ